MLSNMVQVNKDGDICNKNKYIYDYFCYIELDDYINEQQHEQQRKAEYPQKHTFPMYVHIKMLSYVNIDA